MLSKWLEPLASCQLFDGINREELSKILECLNPRISGHNKGEPLTVAGERLDGIGIILAGKAAVTKENASGSRMIITVLGPGELFGEVAAFAGKKTWPATVVAHGDCTAMFLAPEKIVAICEHRCTGHRLLITNMLRIISEKAVMLNKKVEYLTLKSLRGKISAYLLEQYNKTGRPTFVLPLKRDELADFLNVSRPSLSREMGRMRNEGIIDFYRSSVRINDLEALARALDGEQARPAN